MLFADDTSLYVSGHSIADISNKLSCALLAASKWFSDSGLRLNTSKTKSMLVHSCRRKSLPPLGIQLDGNCIEQVKNYKYLGVVLSDMLSWDKHIHLIHKKAAKGIGLL